MIGLITSICFQLVVLDATFGSMIILLTLLLNVNVSSYSLIAKMTAASDKFRIHEDVPGHVWNFFQKWYSRSGEERTNNVLQGEFQDYVGWWSDWYGEEEEEEEEEENE
jgi:hypothetical protein